MSGLKVFDFGSVASDDADVVSHDSAGDVEDTGAALEMLKVAGPPVVKIGLRRHDEQEDVKPEEMARIIVQTEKVAGEAGTLFGFVQDVAGAVVDKSLRILNTYPSRNVTDALEERLRVVEEISPRELQLQVHQLVEELNVEREQRLMMMKRIESLELDLSQYLAGSREIYNSFAETRVVETSPALQEALDKLSAAETERDALRRARPTAIVSGGISEDRPTVGYERINRAPARSAMDLRSKFRPSMPMSEAMQRYNRGER